MTRSLSRRLLVGTISAATAVASVPAAIAATNPDAELIRTCDGHAALMDAVNNEPGHMDDGSPVWRAYTQSRHAISEAEPKTLEGMMAKARVAKAQARQPDGGDDPWH